MFTSLFEISQFCIIQQRYGTITLDVFNVTILINWNCFWRIIISPEINLKNKAYIDRFFICNIAMKYWNFKINIEKGRNQDAKRIIAYCTTRRSIILDYTRRVVRNNCRPRTCSIFLGNTSSQENFRLSNCIQVDSSCIK